MLHTLLTRRETGRFLVAAACLLALVRPATADAQSAARLYAKVAAREKAARATTPPSAVTLRAIARSYEAITRAYPVSGYADNALWQAAGVLTLAYERGKNVRDRDQAIRLLTWLKREYPTGTLAKQVDARLAGLAPPGTASAVPVVASASSAPPIPRTSVTSPPAAPAAPSAAVSAAQMPKSAATALPSTLADPFAPASPAQAPKAAGASPVVAATPKPTAAAAASKTPAGSADAGIVTAPLPPPPLPTSVRSITYTTLPKGDRLTIELSDEARYSLSRAANPDRVLVDLNDSGTAAAIAEKASQISGTLVKSLTVGKVANDATRVILEVAGAPRFSTFPLFNPFRLVVDIESDARPPLTSELPTPAPMTSSSTNFLAKSTTPASAGALLDEAPAPVTPASTSRGDFSLARQLGLGVSRIVIDPGHGGHDPGAQANGVDESELVLDVARRLEALLSAEKAFDVVLTRRTDEFIPLEERTAIANRAAADMFISIHANSSPQPATRGIETYFLDFAANPQAEAVAARENASSAKTMRLLPELVKAITLNNKLDESRELARAVQTSLVRRIAGPNRAIKDLGVKRAPFVVLIGAQMPSVLAEISFLTNRSDAGLLKQATYRQRIAQALFDAVQKYRGSLKQVGTVASN